MQSLGEPTPSNACPDAERLAAFALGKLSDYESMSLEDHLGQCSQCQETLAASAGAGDTVVAFLRRPAVSDPYEHEPALRLGMARAQAMGSGRSDASSDTGHDPLAGRQQVGIYSILQPLGAGGMGVVYKAIHTRLRKFVALKVLPGRLLSRPEAVARFHREMQAIGALDHPYIVRALDAGEADGIHFLAMEYVEGEDLNSLVQRRGPLAISAALTVVEQAARGLAYAHSCGVIHRDIKPSNLLLDHGGVAKLLDLGLARLDESDASQAPAEPLTGSGSVMGTVDYLAPEQALDCRAADARSDIYSLGCTLYFLLTGQPVYDGDTVVKKILGHREKPIPSLQSERLDVTDELDQLFRRMVAKQPEDRFQTMSELLAALESCSNAAAHRSGTTADQPLAVQPERSSRTVRYLLIVGIASLLLGGGWLGISRGGGVYRFIMNQGLLVIASDDLDVEIVVRRNGEQIERIDRKSGFVTALPQGEYRLELTEGRRGLQLSPGRFTLHRGGTQTVKVSFVTALAHDADLPPPKPYPTGRWQPGPTDDVIPGLIPRPAVFPGMRRWQVETRASRRGITAIDWSSDGRRIATRCYFSHARVYDAETLALATILPSPKGGAHSADVAWNPDGTLLAVADTEGKVGLWSAADGLECSFQPRGELRCLGWSSSGDRLATSNGDVLEIWTPAGERAQLFSMPASTKAHQIADLAWNPTGEQVAIVRGNGTVAVMNAETGALHELELAAAAAAPHKKSPVIDWSPAGLAVGRPDGTIFCWQADLTAPTQFPRHHTLITSLAWSRDGRLATAGEDGTVRIWRADGTPEATHAVNHNALTVLAWSPDGKRIAVADWGGDLTTLPVDPEAGEMIQSLLSPDIFVGSVAAASDGRIAAHTYSGLVRIWDRGGEPLPHDPLLANVSWMAMRRDGALAVASYDRSLRLWRADGTPGPMAREDEFSGRMAWSPDGQWLATGRRSVRLWTSNLQLRETFHDFGGEIGALSWSHDGQWLGCVLDSHEVELLHTSTGMRKKIKTPTHGNGGAGDRLAWLPDDSGFVLSGVPVAMWRPDGSLIRTLRSAGALAVALSPDKRQIAAIAGGIRRWSIDGTDQGTLSDNVESGAALAWSADGRHIIMGCNDSTVRVQDGDYCVRVFVLSESSISTTFSGAGEVLFGDARTIEKDFVYIVDHDDGRRELLAPAAFKHLIGSK